MLYSVALVFNDEFQLVDFFQIKGLAYVFWNRNNTTLPYFRIAFQLIHSLPYRFNIYDDICTII